MSTPEVILFSIVAAALLSLPGQCSGGTCARPQAFAQAPAPAYPTAVYRSRTFTRSAVRHHGRFFRGRFRSVFRHRCG